MNSEMTLQLTASHIAQTQPDREASQRQARAAGECYIDLDLGLGFFLERIKKQILFIEATPRGALT